MNRYVVRWEQTTRYEIEVDAGSVADARTAVVFGRVQSPRVTWTSDPRSLSVVPLPDPGTPSLFDVEPDPMPGAVGVHHPETSRAAARSTANRVRFGSQRYRILDLLLGGGPMTAAQIAERLGMSRNQAATRLGECRDAGWVDYARDSWGRVITAPTSADAEGMVQEITQAGQVARRTARADASDLKGDTASQAGEIGG